MNTTEGERLSLIFDFMYEGATREEAERMADNELSRREALAMAYLRLVQSAGSAQ